MIQSKKFASLNVIPKSFEGVATLNNGTVMYLLTENRLHREDGPAIEYCGGTKAWFVNGVCHREDGPAIEYYNGIREWYLNGKRVSAEDVFQQLTDDQKEKVVWELDLWK